MQVRRAEDFLQEMPNALLQERHEGTNTPGDEIRRSQDDSTPSDRSNQTSILKSMEQYYRHFKGNIYRVLHIAKHSETLEDMVVYQAMYGEKGIWVRPKSMFEEVIERDGKTLRRFEPISDEEAEKVINMMQGISQKIISLHPL